MLFKPFEEGPRYKGLPLSYWRKTLDLQRDDRLTQRLEIFLGLRNKLGCPAVLIDPAAVPVLVRLWRDDTTDVWVRMLMPDSDPPSPRDFLRAVIAQLHDKDGTVRASAADMLGAIGYSRQEVVAALIERDGTVRVEAGEALRRIDAAFRGAGIK
jgi:hypothetical protein